MARAPDGRIIDGKHRYAILAGKIPDDKLEILDISDEEAEALAYSLNLDRRHLSLEQAKELRETLLNQTIPKLRKQGMTQKKASQITGVPQQTISRHEKKTIISNTQMGNANKIADMRAKIEKPVKEEIVKRVAAGQNQKEVADDLKITQGRVSQIVQAHETEKRKATKQVEMKKIQEESLAEDLDKFTETEKLLPKLIAIRDILNEISAASIRQDCSVLAHRILDIQSANSLLIECIEYINKCRGVECT